MGAAPTLDLKGQSDLKPLLDRLSKEIRGAHVKVGVLGSKASRDSDDNSPATNIEIAIYNEFGTDSIPERPFLRTTFAKHRQEMVEHLARLLTAVVERGYDVKAGLNIIGLDLSAKVQALIRQGSELTPNAPATIAAKLAKGKWRKTPAKEAPRPLIDSGQLVNSISYSVGRQGDA